jgi:glucokinase
MRIGIDLGGTNIAAGLVDEKNEIITKDSIKTPREVEGMIEAMEGLAHSLCREAKIPFSNVKSAGIGFPGSIDGSRGMVVYANNLDMENVPMADMLSKKLGLPVRIGNDANAAALGEYSVIKDGDIESMLLVTLGTGVGGGFILGGRIYDGFNGMAGELGHMVIVRGGEPCTCGRNGCWEAYASATGLIRMTKEVMERRPDSLMHGIAAEKGKVSGRTAFLAARQGDPAGEEVVDLYLSFVAIGAANLINILQPATLCLGGGVANEGSYLLYRLQPLLAPELYKVGERTTQLRLAKLGNDAGIIGAALL